MYCIQEIDKPKFILQQFNIIQLKENKIILPIQENRISCRKAKKLAQKTKKLLDRSISKRIVISKKIQKQEEYVNFLYIYNFEIIDGKWLFEVLSCKALDYILEKRKIKKEEISISILVNDLSETMLFHIRKIAKEYKRVNIVTRHIEKFKKIEKQILEEDGIMITVGNNKRKGISKSELILNVDFPSELINQYNINEYAIIINLRGNVKIVKKRFNGIVINDYEITFEKRDEFDYDKNTKYKASQIYEGQINKRQPLEEIMKQIEKDKVKITKLIAINTII